MPQPIRENILFTDLSARFVGTSTVAASPTDNTETVIATLTIANFGDIAVVSGIRLNAFAALTVGTSGDGVTLRIRQTNVSGTVVVSTGQLNATAGNLVAPSVLGFDAAPGKGVYVLTLQVHAGAAASTVSALHLSATVV